MPKLNADFKQQIKQLQKPTLEEIVMKLASKDQKVFDFLMVNYLDKENGEQDLFDKARENLDVMFTKRYKGYAEEQKMAHKIAACSKRVTEFAAASKNKKLEADLLMYILKNTFDKDLLASHFETYDNKCATLVRKVISILTTKLHSDYIIEYQDKINYYLKFLYDRSSHLGVVCELPEEI